jgi:hypothetical protein
VAVVKRSEGKGDMAPGRMEDRCEATRGRREREM